MCRYPATRPLFKETFRADTLPERLQDPTWRQACGIDDDLKQAFELPLLVRTTEGAFVAVACNVSQLKTAMSGDGCYRLEIYLDRLPRALVQTSIHKRLIAAVNLKQTPHGRKNSAITAVECILMPDGLDHYMHHPSHITERYLLEQIKGDAPTTPAQLESGVNPLHDYRSNYEPSIRSGNGKAHYDCRPRPYDTHLRRIVLFAECQIGKTGTYLHLLSTLREEIQARHFFLPKSTTDTGHLEMPITTRTWQLPCARWH